MLLPWPTIFLNYNKEFSAFEALGQGSTMQLCSPTYTMSSLEFNAVWREPFFFGLSQPAICLGMCQTYLPNLDSHIYISKYWTMLCLFVVQFVPFLYLMFYNKKFCILHLLLSEILVVVSQLATHVDMWFMFLPYLNLFLISPLKPLTFVVIYVAHWRMYLWKKFVVFWRAWFSSKSFTSSSYAIKALVMNMEDSCN